MKTILENPPYAYFLTFRTLGTWLHSDERTSVDPRHNKIDTPKIKKNNGLYKKMKENVGDNSVKLSYENRRIALASIQETCKYHQWPLFAAHVLSNHVHIVLQSSNNPEFVMSRIKAYATRALRSKSTEKYQEKFWSRHGSTRYIWFPDFLYPVMRYVIEEQCLKRVLYYDKMYDEMIPWVDS